MENDGNVGNTGEDSWRFIGRALQRPEPRGAIDFVRWNGAQSPIIGKIIAVEVERVIEKSCPEIKSLLHQDSTETGVVLLLGRMFAQCFYQYGIEEVIDQSDFACISHKQKLWVSNVVLGVEDCSDMRISEIAHFVKTQLDLYLIQNAERLMGKAAKKVEENFLGQSN
ncbi:hypothetical protein KBB89_02710 [Candidatus Gracilibacteria bacterium]|nr:hypothetical protein [Candidatus Gracilibacteria bacterium]